MNGLIWCTSQDLPILKHLHSMEMKPLSETYFWIFASSFVLSTVMAWGSVWTTFTMAPDWWIPLFSLPFPHAPRKQVLMACIFLWWTSFTDSLFHSFLPGTLVDQKQSIRFTIIIIFYLESTAELLSISPVVFFKLILFHQWTSRAPASHFPPVKL